MLTNGWEFFILNPFDKDIKQSTQDKYVDMYNKAYDSFIGQLCIPEPNDLLEDNFTFMYYIDLNGDSDKVELEEEYEYTFLKSVFLDKKFKKISSDIIEYYKMHNIYVVNMYKQDNAFYLVLNKK
tara:strand:- start:1107 stop:1481 length:375 start_codon:yes stop_codon:yes gene_type:complete